MPTRHSRLRTAFVDSQTYSAEFCILDYAGRTTAGKNQRFVYGDNTETDGDPAHMGTDPRMAIPRSRLPRLYPRTNRGWLYALLTTIPNVFYINTALIAAYFLERFFNWQIAAIGLVCLAIAYGLCRVIVCAVCFIRRRFEKS